MPTRYRTALRNARLQAIIDDAGASAKIALYNGAQPGTLGGTPAGTLLAEGTCAATLGTVSNGVLTFNSVTGDASGNASGTPTWGRVMMSDNTVVSDFTASGAIADVVAGEAYNFSSVTITEGNP